MELPKRYKRGSSLSYTLGPFPTFELLSCRPEAARAVYYREDFTQKDKLISLCRELNVPCSCSQKALERMSQKEICYAAGEFVKYPGELLSDRPHIALVHPGDMGNLGTIERTILGFGIRDLAIIGGGADHWNPKAVRASMGAVFRLRIGEFESFDEYLDQFGRDRDIFPFMLDGGRVLTPGSCPKTPLYTLVFGNEATGLPPEFQNYGQSLFIAQTGEVDSLNLAVAVSIGTYLFTQCNGGAD
jgi:TrmH family RNA methyltransferase